jgi:hypothetical protein
MTATAYPLAVSRRSRLREFRAAVATIMVKELRSRMRGRRAFVVLTIYLGLLSLIAYGTYTVVSPIVQQGFEFGFGMSAVNASARIGQSIFTVLSLFQLLLVCFIAPAFTSAIKRGMPCWTAVCTIAQRTKKTPTVIFNSLCKAGLCYRQKINGQWIYWPCQVPKKGNSKLIKSCHTNLWQWYVEWCLASGFCTPATLHRHCGTQQKFMNWCNKYWTKQFGGQIGFASGIIGAAGGVGGFLLPSWLGVLKDLSGTYRTGLLVFAAFCVVAWLSTWKQHNPAPKEGFSH